MPKPYPKQFRDDVVRVARAREAGATLGWILGGTVGIGTVLVALCMGPLLGIFLPRVIVRLTPSTPTI